VNEPDGQARVILRRLDALGDAIRDGRWDDVSFHYENVRSAVEKRLGVRGRDYDEPAVEWPDGMLDEMKAAAATTDTFSFQIENKRPELSRTLSSTAIDAAGDQFKAWIAARLLGVWKATGLAPKFVNIDVKVGVE
jgi:hypothetical protein